MKGHDELFAQELVRGEKVAWLLRWFIFSILFLLAGVVYLLQHAGFAILGMGISAAFLVFNAALSPIIAKGSTKGWIRYATVTLDVVLLTFYNAWETLTSSPYTPVSTAMILVYPIVILLAALRLDRRLIVYATALATASMAGLYAMARPLMDPAIQGRLSSADIPGAFYRCTYLVLLGAILYLVPQTVERLLKRQCELQAESREHLERANTDKLTGLANRRQLDLVLERAIEDASREDRGCAVLFIDLDGFKAINDRLGHDAGDLVLVEIAGRIKGAARETDFVARVGGDEFVVVAERTGHGRGLEQIAERILEAIDRPLRLSGAEASVGASIGISVFPLHGPTAANLVREADRAMYAAKRAGKNRVRLASDSGTA